MIQLLESGDDADFDSYFAQGVEDDPVARTTLAKRKEPYGSDSMAVILHVLEEWDLTDVAGQITCPILITEPEDEQFWPGQSRQLFDLVGSPVNELMSFTAEEGGNWHCEPMAPQLRAQRIFDWLAEVVS